MLSHGVFADGRQEWRKGNRLHRKNEGVLLPAVINPDGSTICYHNGKIAVLDNETVIVDSNGTHWMTKNGLMMRKDKTNTLPLTLNHPQDEYAFIDDHIPFSKKTDLNLSRIRNLEERIAKMTHQYGYDYYDVDIRDFTQRLTQMRKMRWRMKQMRKIIYTIKTSNDQTQEILDMAVRIKRYMKQMKRIMKNHDSYP